MPSKVQFPLTLAHQPFTKPLVYRGDYKGLTHIYILFIYIDKISLVARPLSFFLNVARYKTGGPGTRGQVTV